jgi:hypothetical protein
MARAIKFAVVMVCILCILAICIAPLVDLPAANLRSYQVAVMLLCWLVASAFSLILSTLKPFVCVRPPTFGPADQTRWRVDVPMHMKVSTILRC